MKSILVKAPNWIGDCIMATPALALLRRVLPDIRIDVLARPGVADILRNNPHLTGLIVADDRKLSQEVLQHLRGRDYDAVVLMPNSFGSAWLAFKLHIPRRIGFARGWRRLLLTHSVPYVKHQWQTPTIRPLSAKSIKPPKESPADWPRHMVDYYLALAHRTIESLRIESTIPIHCDLVLPVAAASELRVSEIIEDARLKQKKLAGITPGGAYGPAKRWPPIHLAAVADALAANGYEVVSTASKNESTLTDEVAQHATCTIHRLGEKVDVQGLVALINNFSVLVTNDSGPMHIAAARNIPTIGIFGPTDWNVTPPWSPEAEVVRKSPDCAPCFLRICPIDHRCMNDITPDMVIAALRGIAILPAS